MACKQTTPEGNQYILKHNKQCNTTPPLRVFLCSFWKSWDLSFRHGLFSSLTTYAINYVIILGTCPERWGGPHPVQEQEGCERTSNITQVIRLCFLSLGTRGSAPRESNAIKPYASQQADCVNIRIPVHIHDIKGQHSIIILKYRGVIPGAQVWSAYRGADAV